MQGLPEVVSLARELGQPVTYLLIGVGGYHWLTRGKRNGAASAEAAFRATVIERLGGIVKATEDTATNTAGLQDYMARGSRAIEQIGILKDRADRKEPRR